MAKIYAALAMKKTRPTAALTLEEVGLDSFFDRLESDLLETSLVKLPARAILGDRSPAGGGHLPTEASLSYTRNMVRGGHREIFDINVPQYFQTF